MPWIDPWGTHFDELPPRIRLSDFTTRTAHEVTPENALAGGWTFIDPSASVQIELSPDAQLAADTVLGAQ